MIQIPGSAEELNALRSEHFHHPHPRVQMKMAAVQLTALGADRSLVAAMLGFTETPVRTYLKVPCSPDGDVHLATWPWKVSIEVGPVRPGATN